MTYDRFVSRTARGFTLIEVMVAITVLGVFAVVLSSGLRTSLRAWSRGNAELDSIRSSEATLSLLRRQIEGALPVIYAQAGDNRASRLRFAGNARSLRLVSRSSFRDGPESAPRWIEYSWETGSGSGGLTVRESAVDPGEMTPGSDTLWKGTVFQGENLRFDYLPRRNTEQQTEWVSSWDESNLQMPAAVRVTFTKSGRLLQMTLPLRYAENTWTGQWFF